MRMSRLTLSNASPNRRYCLRSRKTKRTGPNFFGCEPLDGRVSIAPLGTTAMVMRCDDLHKYIGELVAEAEGGQAPKGES